MADRLNQVKAHLSSPSIEIGPTKPDLLELTLGDLIRSNATTKPESLAVISHWQGRSLTYRQLDDESEILAKQLVGHGIKKGDRVAICAGNCIEYVTTIFAVAKAGAILVVLNPVYTPDDLVRGLKKVGVKILIIAQALAGRSFRSHIEAARMAVPKIFLVPDEPRTINIIPLFSDLLLPPYTTQELPTDLSPHDIVNLQFTSGTTGPPKAACLTHHNLINNGRFVGDRLCLSNSDVLCIPVPLFHCFGLVLGNLAAFTHQSCVVYPSETFQPRAVLQSVEKYRCTAVHGVPTMFIAMLEILDSEKFNTSSLRTGIAAGTIVNAELMTRIQKRLGLPELKITYGMTETSPASTMTTGTDPMIKRTTTVGRVLPHTIVQIVDEDMKPVARGQSGEVVVSGYLLQKEYWNDTQASQNCLFVSNGRVFLKTGDVGSLDAEGYLSIHNRIKDIVIRGGENISPSEIENVLAMHESVVDVSVVAVKDDRYGEVPAAFIKLSPTKPVSAERLIGFAHDKLAHYKVPAYIFFLVPEEDFPLTASGKVQKFKLRERAEKLVLDSRK